MRSAGATSRSTRKRTQSATSSIAANRNSLSSACMKVRPNPPEPRTFGVSTVIPASSSGGKDLAVVGPGLPLGSAVQIDQRTDRVHADRRAVQPGGELQPVTSGDAYQRRISGSRTTAGGLAVDPFPLPGPRIDKFDGARHRRSLDGHRHHRTAGADAQLTDHRARQRDGLGKRLVGILEDL